MEPKQNKAQAGPLIEFVARNRRVITVLLCIVGVVLAINTILFAVGFITIFRGLPGIGVGIALGGLAISALFGGIVPLLNEPPKDQQYIHARILILATGGLTGFVLVLVSIALAISWWNDILTWLSPLSEGKNIGYLITVASLLGAGLFLMFASLQVARTEERTNATLRRLLYGYNAVLTGFLLLMIVVLATVGLSTTVKAPLDFTATKDFSLSDKSIKVLQSLKVPVEITFIHGFEDPLLEDQTDTLLKNSQNYTDKLEVTELVPQADQARTKALMKTYPGIDSGSLLLVYTKPGTDKKEHRIIPERDLVPPQDFTDRGPTRAHKFIGEDALMTVLNSLSEDKELPVLYFLQGHGELDPNDTTMAKIDTACGVFKRRLEARKTFEIKTLTFDPLKPEVPSKAALLAIIGPRRPYSPDEVKALQDYMAKGGRMLVMLDLIVGSDKKAAPSGLEKFLEDHAVKLTDERIITLPVQFPLPPHELLATMNPKYLQQNPLVAPFLNDPFQLSDVRPLQPQGDKPGGKFLTMPLMVVASFSFAESNLAVDPSQIVQDLRRNREALQKKLQEIQVGLQRNPIAVGVAVTENEGNNPHAGIAGPANPTPRMMVIGCASMAANRFMDERLPVPNFDFLASTIEWLRGKDQNIGIDAKVNRPFMLTTKSDDEKRRMIYLPPFLLVGCVLGLGCGVWIARRR